MLVSRRDNNKFKQIGTFTTGFNLGYLPQALCLMVLDPRLAILPC